ncbi:hypothetical protein P7228_08105 [Altererythrobacter arenosus]|uniref:Isopropylmalate isomerase n=1 Tax=Altererythrobacter arenosus TaxID=3032592 RepID=A0ABY8FLS9_9SPHN|nr:hypothetical protein [Altererythrobacter sp. CAU 1644]WFL75973.1 hypothetical protein P7228_08105 [Altererythrobacter sp. CAU 1644]
MPDSSPSMLSLIAAALYLGVAAVAGRAGKTSGLGGGEKGDMAWWFAIASLFVLLAAMRVFLVEDQVRMAFRAVLSGAELYETRRSLQRPLALLALLATSAVLGAIIWTAIRETRALVRALRLAQLAACAMIALVGMRLISLGPIDYVLFGPLRPNWIIDLGASLCVGLAASRYAALTENREPRR